MSVKAHELPELIAAAVRKAVAEKQITDERLAALAHHPITIGLVATSLPEGLKTGGDELTIGRLRAPSTMGYQLKTLEDLRHTATLTGGE